MSKTMPDKLELSVNLVNAILGYLGSQPYQSVAQLIHELQKEAAPQLPSAEVEAISEE